MRKWIAASVRHADAIMDQMMMTQLIAHQLANRGG
jgi:hypothetical protein